MHGTKQYRYPSSSTGQSSVSPRARSRTLKCCVYGTLCGLERAIKILPRQYAAAVAAAVHSKQKERVFEILDALNADGVEGDEVYGRAVGAACQSGQHALLLSILNYMHTSGVDCAIGYRDVRRWAFKSGEYYFVLELLRLMKERGMDPTGGYKHHIMSLHKAGSYGDVPDVYKAMRKAGCSCDEDTYSTAVASAVEATNKGEVMSTVDDMKQNADLLNTRAEMFPPAVRAAIRSRQNQLTLELFDFMDQTGVDVSAVYRSAIRTAFKSEQHDFVFDILQKMKENGVDASEEYGHVVMSFGKLDCYDHALRAFNTMRELGYNCTTALRAAVKLDRHDDFVAISNGLGGKDSTPTSADLHTLEHAYVTGRKAYLCFKSKKEKLERGVHG